VADLLRAQGHTVTLQIIKTTGDKITDVALSMVGTRGMFTKEIEEAWLPAQSIWRCTASRTCPPSCRGIQSGGGDEARKTRVMPSSRQTFRYQRASRRRARRHQQPAAARASCGLSPRPAGVPLRGNIDSR